MTKKAPLNDSLV